MKRTVYATTLAALAALIACGVQSSGPSEATHAASTAQAWTHYSAPVTEDGHQAMIEYWVRGTDVVRRYWEEGTLRYDERCEGRRLTVHEILPSGYDDKPPFTYREVSDREDAESCFAAATYDELKFLHAPSTLPQAESTTTSDGRAALRWVGPTGHEFIVDAQTSLPIRSDYGTEDDTVITVAFGAFSMTTEATNPPAPRVEWAGFQETLDVPVDEAGQRQGLTEVPSSIEGLPLSHSSSFRTQNLEQPTYYLIWGDDSRNVQMVTTVATLPEEFLGYSADGTEYNAQDGAKHVKIGTVGGDAALLRAALKALRPSALDDQRVH
ncbi:hypothetical protein LVJ94_27135 [Pendulispora rubella]|uniref:Lipoprotein n=1 Tax=Pendulispora rubella TaxID=2741070 RepID=A0ABZ2KUC1_9BACT